jgi:hypothetical protein
MWKLKASIPQIVELLKSSWARNAVKIFLKYTVNSLDRYFVKDR